jgi:hypothetical protein
MMHHLKTLFINFYSLFLFINFYSLFLFVLNDYILPCLKDIHCSLLFFGSENDNVSVFFLEIVPSFRHVHMISRKSWL